MQKRLKVAYIVDSVPYIKQEPNQRQLFEKLIECSDIYPIELQHRQHTSQIPWDLRCVYPIGLQQITGNQKVNKAFDRILVCLKLRTLTKNIENLSRYLDGMPCVIYDLDPWENYKDGSPFKGTYEKLLKHVNVEFIANTTKWWVKHGLSKNIPCKFVKMGILPAMCNKGPDFIKRPYDCGFIGTLHSHRKQLVEVLSSQGVKVYCPTTRRSYSHEDFLKNIQNIKIQVHKEEQIYKCDNINIPLSSGLWIKDIEAASRGCFSIRNYHSDFNSYIDKEIETVFMFGHDLDAKNVIENILSMDPKLRQNKINRTVQYIKERDNWKKTAEVLVGIKENV